VEQGSRFVLKSKMNIWLLCCAAAAWGQSVTGQPGVRRLYVETFSIKPSSGELRQDVIAHLRKLASVTLVTDKAGADLILIGSGEIWVKGYRSLNPRSGRSPLNGTPLYGGFLSVELRNTRGETLWSYLAAPSAPSEDILKDLSKRVVKQLEAVLPARGIPLPGPTPSQPMTRLKGAGATFPYPIYARWFADFSRQNPAVQIGYEAIGSEAGIRKLLDGEVDFGASDNPEIFRELAPGKETTYLLFPSVIGAAVPIVNLPGLAGDIVFTPEILAGIYLGKITKWNDPLLRQANRGLDLPDLDIMVVHRADGSGTTYMFTDYLSRTNAEWKQRVGAGLAPSWPVGRAATGNDGVAKLVKELGGSIGYVEFIYALQNHLSFGRVRNRQGRLIAADLESIAAAASTSAVISNDFKVSIVDSPGADAYPIASFTWLVVPAHITDDARRAAIASFLRWMLGPGQRQVAALGYLSLPKDVVTKEESAIARIQAGQ
jgi:phosphate transport system substrate-binding protein